MRTRSQLSPGLLGRRFGRRLTPPNNQTFEPVSGTNVNQRAVTDPLIRGHHPQGAEVRERGGGRS